VLFAPLGGRLRIPDVAIEDGGRYICSKDGRTQVLFVAIIRFVK